MTDILASEYVDRREKEKSQWMDAEVIKHLPFWQGILIMLLPKKFVCDLLKLDIQIGTKGLIANFGEEVVIKINNKIVAKRKFK